MKLDINKYDYLWNGSESGWCLLKSDDMDEYSIVNEINSIVLHIDAQKLKELLCNEMLSKDIKTIKTLPKVEIIVEESNISVKEIFKKQNE